MKTLPTPATYEAEYSYWPWSRAIDVTTDFVCALAPSGGVVVDYMCGTGYLLRRIHKVRADLTLLGFDQNLEYIDYAARAESSVRYYAKSFPADDPVPVADVALCTAGIHHLRPSDQQKFISSLHRGVRQGGLLIVGEEVIAPFTDESSRREGVMNLWFAAIREIVRAGAPYDVVDAALSVFRGDLFLDGEYKGSLASLTDLLQPHFLVESISWAWQVPDSEAGDVVLLCRKA